jgi:hypothetical protein
MTASPRQHDRLFADWGEWAQIVAGQIWLLRSNQYFWREFNEGLVENRAGTDGTFPAHYSRLYADAQLMTLRRLGENSGDNTDMSLANLLAAIRRNPRVLTFDRFRNLPVIYPTKPLRWFHDVPVGHHQDSAAVFDGLVGDGQGGLSLDRLDGDADALQTAVARVKARADKVIAHIDRHTYLSNVKDATSYADMHEVVDTVADLGDKWVYVLRGGSPLDSHPMFLNDWHEPLREAVFPPG